MKLPRNVDGDELARLLNRLDIELITRREAISVCLQIFPGKHMTLQFPVTNLFGWVHCMKFLRMLQNIRKLAGNKLSWTYLDNC